MGTVALRGIRAHLVRFLLSLLAVALGVSFVAGTFSLRTMLSSTFTGIVNSSMVGDAYVRGSEASARGASDIQTEARNPVPLSLAQDLAGVDGVERVIPDVQGPVVLVGADGTAVTSTQAPSFATALFPGDPTAQVLQGRLPAAPTEIALESATLRYSGLYVGDTTTIVLGGQVKQVHVVGEISLGSPMAGATIVVVDEATAISTFAPTGTVVDLAVYAKDGVSQAQLVEHLDAALPARAEAVTGDAMRAETRSTIEKALGFISTFLLVFAGISLFVGAFIIANTFTMSVRERMREFALLRAIGASPSQVFASILLQAAAIGVVGSALGVAGGLGLVSALRVLFERMGMTLSGSIPLDASTVLVSIGIGTLVSLLAALVPARRAALVPPVEAMRDDVVDQEHSLRIRSVAGWALVALGVGGVLVAIVRPQADQAGTFLGIGAAAVVLGMLTLAPVIARFIVSGLAVPFVALLRPVGRLARGNVTRNPRRTASTAGALMIGMALVGAASVLAATTQASTREIVAADMHADFILQSATGSIPPDALDALRHLGSVAKVDTFDIGSAVVTRPGTTAVSGTASAAPTTLVGMDFSAFGSTIEVDEIDGTMASVGADGVAVLRSEAKAHDWKVGDHVTLTSDLGTRTATVRAVFVSAVVDAPMVVSKTLYDEIVPADQSLVKTALVTDAAGTTPGTARSDIVTVVKPYVVISVLDSAEFASSLAKQVDQVLVILYALLGLSIVIAVLGIVNTLALSVIERTREIGLLRAVGLGRTQLAGTVVIESVLTAVFGTVVGVGVGVALAAAMPTVFSDVGLTTLAIPWASLAWMLMLAVVVGVLAAVWPAIRAARLPVLDAISYE
ncbi:MAG TPA: FtsX-like permease family protein [Cellulomonas sp.]|uniref:ABC transporter permease n=1 Tax=Cellulomonas sp. TaxID=40001 RepID=UPI002E2F0453|nr:FtsX-like permease family protein [Cellulomonas sp.]HEX5333461.1 FtsX-like permease family protein [Cellulomonas sp.]